MAEQRSQIPHLSSTGQYGPREGDRHSDDFDERFLLTPPVTDQPMSDPFEIRSPSQLAHLLSENASAYRRNTQKRDSGSDSAKEGGQTRPPRDLYVRTDLSELRRTESVDSTDSNHEPKIRSSTSAGSIPLRIPSFRHRLHSTAGSISPGSVISSPLLAAMLDVTPLPSPIMGPSEWRNLARSRSRASSTSSRTSRMGDLPPPIVVPQSSPRKSYGLLYGSHRHWSGSDTLSPDQMSGVERARSISDYIPDLTPIARLRQVTDTAMVETPITAIPSTLHRESYLADSRGIGAKLQAQKDLQTQVHSEDLMDTSDSLTPRPLPSRSATSHRVKVEVWSAQSIHTGETKNYETIRLLGQGTFSKVYLAVRIVHDHTQDEVDYRKASTDMAGVRARSRRLVAVKVIEPGPAGGADADRVAVSLKREVELMKQIKHPSIIHLKSVGTQVNGRALLVMNYCPGGDLFDLASTQSSVLTPPLIRRIFAELVSAVRFLHQKYIVHRDIKLENVLLNIPVQVHPDVSNWQTLDRAVVTLTDLGLSRTIPRPPESPLLETRCGSEDYAAPEILMGQPYDGRQTDAWALGVLLYALMEGRLPFDAHPQARGDPETLRARTPHRIARIEWSWIRYGDEDGDWDPQKGSELQGAMKCVDGLLKRNTRRKDLNEIREWPWVKDGITVDGGLRWVEEEAM